ncbi:D-alanyl-D-alanine carboxypeptidase/D-alanyl-D-alanine-endopeptidase [Neobacillus novalis]|uniref:D-alanyl-D-alanine carboxypeptidase/D-alanyl-D-alanine-endopeptidase n=1 Tax=Neobacillus novalis TaxID=220687 RepID=A0AA95MHV2_9BACI|nr:D-alanyl-D-alanine carboxypeptidase/D-alanyl-D-alanine-endopeptidase [Neobacillus novalis]WHY83885.1 D-alanyl-D-alanine carboxypeptidase/D-alanyl-D-alanine-endopeptidase [Neobacillus novalis]
MNRWKAKWGAVMLTFMLMISLVLPVQAQTTEEEKLSQLLQAYVQQLSANPNSEGMSVGYEVYSLDDDKTLASYHSDKTFVPASVFKLLVTAAAVSKWPKEMTIPTKVFTTGNLSNSGVLNGDIILKGFGDPTLTVEKLDTLAKNLAALGIHKVNGNVIVDESYFDNQRLGEDWMWDDEPYSYSTQTSALSVRENTVNVTVHPGKEIGESPTVTIDPAPDYLTVVNKAKTVAGSNASLTIDRTLGKNEIAVSGTIGKNYSANGYTLTRTIHDPAPFTGTVFRDFLIEQGITFKNKSTIEKGSVADDARLVAAVESPKLDDILTEMVKESDNFYAEMLTKLLGAKESVVGSTAAGIEVIHHFLVNNLGLEDGFIQKDGSGLTRLDHISPHAYIQLLNSMYDGPERDRFISFLPIAGKDGTLKNRMKGTAAEGNVMAKTGSMSGVNSLAGYVSAKNGQTLAFSILLNGIYKSSFATNLQNQIAIAVAQYPELPNPPASTPESPSFPLAKVFDPLLDDPAFKGIIKGAVIYSTKKQEVLYARSPQSLLTPGASVKLLTTASALDNLGQNYRFKTELYTTGTIRNGILNGDIIVKGYGDPTLATDSNRQELGGPTMEGIAQDLKNAGIHLLKGNIIMDSQFFTEDVYAPGWTWDHESEQFQPQITALSVNHGTVRLQYEPEKTGKNINVTMEPRVDEIKIVNTAITGEAKSKNTLAIKRVRGDNTIEISGTLPAGTEKGFKDVSIDAPHLYTGYVFKNMLKEAGVNVSPHSQVVSAAKPADANLVNSYESPPLAEIVTYMNHHNDNFTAEMIIRSLGALINGKGTFDDGIDTVYTMMNRVISTPFDMMDGSGLTKYTQISAAQVASLLTAETQKPTFPMFYDSLANAGEDGSLKTGLDNISSPQLTGILENREDMPGLSGYIKTKDGDLLAFSLLLNGYSQTESKQLVKNFAQKLVDITQ